LINIVLDHITCEPFYCPFCRKTTLPRNKPFSKKSNVCEHLLYLGTTEKGFEYCKEEVEAFLERFDGSFDEEELFKLDIANVVHFSLCEPAPSFFETFIGYVKYVDAIQESTRRVPVLF
jgi:hypothetical protein